MIFLIFLLFLQLITLSNTVKYNVDDIRICFPSKGVFKNYFPPNINDKNSEDEEIYSVSNNQRISKPILAYLCTKNNIPINENYIKKNAYTFTITSVPVTDLNYSPGNCSLTAPPDANIQFCQYGSDEFELNDPRRFDKKYFKKLCTKVSKVSNDLLLPSSMLIRGIWLIAHGLYHTISNIETVESYSKICLLRRIMFTIFARDGNIITKTITNPIKIYTRIAELQWLEPSAEQILEVFANHPFNISLQIVDQNKEVIESGLDSSLIVEVTLRYQTKIFTRETLVNDFLYKTEITIHGDEIIRSHRNYDLVFHKRAKKGLVTFSNVCIRELHPGGVLFLNATLMVPRTNDRQPREKIIDRLCVKMFGMKSAFHSTKFCDFDFQHDCNLAHDSETAENQLYTLTEQCDSENKLKSVKFVRLKILGLITKEIAKIELI